MYFEFFYSFLFYCQSCSLVIISQLDDFKNLLIVSSASNFNLLQLITHAGTRILSPISKFGNVILSSSSEFPYVQTPYHNIWFLQFSPDY